MSFAELNNHDLDYEELVEIHNDSSNSVVMTGVPAWVTKDLHLIPIHKMSTQHIINCLRKIQQSDYKWRPSYGKYFLQELVKRDVNIDADIILECATSMIKVKLK